MQSSWDKRITIDDEYSGVDFLTILHLHGNTVQNLGV
jgi:hypothetical protein